MSLFRRKKEDPDEIPGIVKLYFEQDEKPLEENREIVEEHLINYHKPGRQQEEKRKHDFVDLGMPRAYMDALDDLEFTLHELISGGDQVVARWTVQGIHRRDLLGLAPSGEAVTIDGLMICVVKYERIRQIWAYWELPQLTERLVGAGA